MDFGGLPPEVNSGLMYLGPGSGSLLVAAASWDALSAELFTAASGYAAVISDLAPVWRGPSSLAMTTAVTPFAEWLHGAAESAAQIAGHARTAAAAYALAFAMTVPPPVIAANRSLLLALVATNFFGQNSAAIAAAETHYAQMWSQDATAMYLYADSSATASVLPPVKQPPQSPLSSPVVQILEHVPNVTNSVLSSANAVTSGRGIWAVNMRLAAQEVAEPGPSFPGGARLVSAAVRRGISVGTLSAPPSWGAAAPEMRSPAMPLSGPAAAASAETAGCGSVFGQSALGTLSRSEPRPARHKSKPIIVRSPAAG